MTDFLHRLVDRVTAAVPTVRPRLPGLFEPAFPGPGEPGAGAPAAPAPLDHGALDGDVRSSAFVPDRPASPDPPPVARRGTAWPGPISGPRTEPGVPADTPGDNGPAQTVSAPAIRIVTADVPGETPGHPAAGAPGGLPAARPTGLVSPLADVQPEHASEPDHAAPARGADRRRGAPPQAGSARPGRAGTAYRSNAPDALPTVAAAPRAFPPAGQPDDRPEPAPFGERRPVVRAVTPPARSDQRTEAPAVDRIAARRGDAPAPAARAARRTDTTPANPADRPEPVPPRASPPAFRPATAHVTTDERTDSVAVDQIATRRRAPVDAGGLPYRSGSVGQRPAGPPHESAPTISVTIGRIEVRAAAAPPAPRPATQKPVSTALEDYLRQRARGSAP